MTTAWLDAVCAVRTRFDTEATVALNLPTQHDNQKDIDPDMEAPFCRFSIATGRQSVLEMSEAGARTYLTDAVATASIFTPTKQGDRVPLTLADQIAAKFKAKSVGSVVYLSPSVHNRMRSGDLWRIDITIPFYVEDLG